MDKKFVVRFEPNFSGGHLRNLHRRLIPQTDPVTKLPSQLVVAGLRPSDQTSPVTESPSKLVVRGFQPLDLEIYPMVHESCIIL